jgi:hypothetical protein
MRTVDAYCIDNNLLVSVAKEECGLGRLLRRRLKGKLYDNTGIVRSEVTTSRRVFLYYAPAVDGIKLVTVPRQPCDLKAIQEAQVVIGDKTYDRLMKHLVYTDEYAPDRFVRIYRVHLNSG